MPNLKKKAARRRAEQADRDLQRRIERRNEDRKDYYAEREAERKEETKARFKESAKKPRRAAAGLKVPGDDQKGLKKLPKDVRNKMGYMEEGGKTKKPNRYGTGGGTVAQSSLYQTVKNATEWNKKKNYLESAIEAAKGTPKAKVLVEAHREHMKNMPRKMKDGGKLKKRLNKIAAKAQKKAEKAHARGEKKGGKVVGTKRVTTAAEPRMLSSKRETVKVYEKEQKALDKGVRKQSKAIDRDYFKGERKKKRKAKRAGANIIQRAVAKSKRRSTGSGPRRTGGALSRAIGRVSERIANKGTAGSKARKRSRGCGKDCQKKIRAGKAGFNK